MAYTHTNRQLNGLAVQLLRASYADDGQNDCNSTLSGGESYRPADYNSTQSDENIGGYGDDGTEFGEFSTSAHGRGILSDDVATHINNSLMMVTRRLNSSM